MWTYKGADVFPADSNVSGIRWYARTAGNGPWRNGTPAMLLAESKAGMREIISNYRP